MGNSSCCISIGKEKLQYEIQVNIVNEKEINDNEINDNEVYVKKTTTALSQQSNENNDFINPLPTIVIIKPKKNKLL